MADGPKNILEPLRLPIQLMFALEHNMRVQWENASKLAEVSRNHWNQQKSSEIATVRYIHKRRYSKGKEQYALCHHVFVFRLNSIEFRLRKTKR